MYLVVRSAEVNAPAAARPWGKPPIFPAVAPHAIFRHARSALPTPIGGIGHPSICNETHVEALFVFSLFRRLPGAHRAQPQGIELRDRADPPYEGRRRAAAPRIPRHQPADARARARRSRGRSHDASARETL